ncbi:MAG TPA: flagellar basal body L-ring protein FlgH [Spirochaetota bacterium]|nr:flagellar basal body L-ring protein FlgH [Spirochaetota bacterium]HPS85611.1 flagellar basal body L-ring protein FlgH [Spirochaetota bacterium]
MIRNFKLIILFIFLTSFVNAATIWQDKDVYSTDTNLKVGDIIIINVKDFSKLKFDVALNNNTSSDVISNPDMTITGFLPKISSNKNIKNNESTNFNGNSKIDIAIAARVTEKQNNGFSVISGVRIYTFNGVTNTIQVAGIIDPKLLNAGSIDSEMIADFRIQITGRKEGLTIRKAQVAEGEKAFTDLTEPEKQQIVIDYLEKMIRELTR